MCKLALPISVAAGRSATARALAGKSRFFLICTLHAYCGKGANKCKFMGRSCFSHLFSDYKYNLSELWSGYHSVDVGANFTTSSRRGVNSIIYEERGCGRGRHILGSELVFQTGTLRSTPPSPKSGGVNDADGVGITSDAQIGLYWQKPYITVYILSIAGLYK